MQHAKFHYQKSGLGTPFFSVRYVTFFSVLKKERSVLFCSFLEFLATYDTQKNAKNSTERKERKERKRTQRTQHSFAKNGKELENVSFFCKRTRERSVPFFYIYIDIYRYIQTYIYKCISKKERNILFTFFCARFAMFVGLMKPKRTFRSFIKNRKEHKDCSVLL